MTLSTRRFNLKTLIVTGVATLAIGATAFGVSSTIAAQPHMTDALNELQTALSQLNDAIPDKDGHRVEAISLVKQAITQTTEGLAAGAI
jgi:hypothetical protein